MDLNLDTLKREILEYLESSGLAVFHSAPGGLEGLPMVLWDTERHPDYQMFLDTALKTRRQDDSVRRARVRLPPRSTRPSRQLDDCDFSREERRDLRSRLRELRVHEGVTCSLELAFDHHSRMYVYEMQPDWYDEFLSIGDEIAVHLPADEDRTGRRRLAAATFRITDAPALPDASARWLIPEARPRGKPRRLAAALGIACPPRAFCCARELGDPEAARRFLDPSLADLHAAWRAARHAEAVARLRRAIAGGEQILIYGDYDVDGTTSVVILKKAIEMAGGQASFFIPHRLRDGYGMRAEVVEKAAAEGVKLIISVDTGIRAAEVVRARQ